MYYTNHAKKKEEKLMTTKLDCNVEHCAYNADHCCKRTDIEVKGENAKVSADTSCGSFAPSGKAKNLVNACGCAKQDTQVHCDAVECMYNSDRMCHANHIGISGREADTMQDTECASFVMG